MKELNLLFRRLSGFNKFPEIFALTLVAVLAACSSRISTESSTVVARETKTKPSLPLISVSDAVRESWFNLSSDGKMTTHSPLRVSAKSCIDMKFVFAANLRVLGQDFGVTLEEDEGQLVAAIVEDSETKLTEINLPAGIKEQICQAPRSPDTELIVLSEAYLKQLQELIAGVLLKIAPDCRKINFESTAAVCKLDQMMPQVAVIKTEDFQKSMIRKWSRQPYILARRTGVVSTLARAATNLTNDEAFAKFCKVLQFSLPEELPIVMTSRRWQTALCSPESESRREAAFYGLAKGTQELEMLRELYEGTSRVGVLSVKIPGSEIPETQEVITRQPLRVIISPDDEVSQKLVDQAKKYLGRTDLKARPRRSLRNKRGSNVRKFIEVASANQGVQSRVPEPVEMCWHPVFGEAYGLLRIADGMKLTGKGFSLECGYLEDHSDSAETDMAALSKYLLQSLSSETEFVIDNGQSKLLRLPEGHYRYTVQLLPENPLDSESVDEEAVPKTSGDLNWDSSKRHAIRSW
jgi:hypothetical protein